MTEETYTIELTHRQLIGVRLFSMGYLSQIMSRGGFEPLTSEFIPLKASLAVAEAIELFNKLLDTPDDVYPELIENFKKSIAEADKDGKKQK